MMIALMLRGKRKKAKKSGKEKEDRAEAPPPSLPPPAPFLGPLEVYRGYDRDKKKSIYEKVTLPIPMTATAKNIWEKAGWSGTIKTLLEGILEEEKSSTSGVFLRTNRKTSKESCVLSLLRGKESVLLRHIYSFLSNANADKVVITPPHKDFGNTMQSDWEAKLLEGHYQFDLDDLLAYTVCGRGNFPDPDDRNINMMPFVFGDVNSLPEEYRCYWPMIQQCEHCNGYEEGGQVGYLTIHESYVEASNTQRRGGIHVEAPGNDITLSRFVGTTNPIAGGAPGIFWGGGKASGGDIVEGGIFLASTVANTSMVWNALIKDKSIVGKDGDCEHLRRFFGDGIPLPANQLIWMTDRTPHEALPQTESGYRQFFRVVTSRVSQWHADHSTPNPLVAVPDHVEIIRGNKFAAD